MRKLFGLVTVLCLLTRALPVLALDNGNGASGGYLGSDAFFHREINGAGQRALARSALSTHFAGTRRHQRRATRRVGSGARIWERMAHEDRQKGYFRIRAGQPASAQPGRSGVRERGTRHERPVATQAYRPPVSDGSHHPPVSDGSYHPPVSDGSYQAPTTGR